MAENSDNWRSRLEYKRDNDRKSIDDALNTTAAPWIIGIVIVAAVIWAIVDTFV